MRRVVTGTDAMGTSVFVSDDEVAPLTVVLNGSRHSWHDESDQPCTTISAVIGAERTS